jgi:hypothetical protein
MAGWMSDMAAGLGLMMFVGCVFMLAGFGQSLLTAV